MKNGQWTQFSEIWVVKLVSSLNWTHSRKAHLVLHHPRQLWAYSDFMVGTHYGTSPCNKSQGLVPSCELAIFAAKSSQFGPCD